MVEQLHSLAGRVSDLAREVGQIGRRHRTPAVSAREPCARCGEETAVGSVFFSDRLQIRRQDRPDAFLCRLCNAQIRASHKPVRWRDEDVAAFTRNASAAAINWLGRY
jgi:hypothetical protein